MWLFSFALSPPGLRVVGAFSGSSSSDPLWQSSGCLLVHSCTHCLFALWAGALMLLLSKHSGRGTRCSQRNRAENGVRGHAPGPPLPPQEGLPRHFGSAGNMMGSLVKSISPPARFTCICWADRTWPTKRLASPHRPNAGPLASKCFNAP